MKRLGIFQLYDPDGYVDEFKYVLLESMLGMLNKLIIVINGGIEEEALLRLRSYTDNVHIREEDTGFDAGAFRDVFLKFYERGFFEQWDEVVMFNDTFYGPLCPWSVIFGRMEKEKVDFWGLEKSTWKQGIFKYPTEIIPYFLVIRKKLLLSNVFFQFWIEVGYPADKIEGIKVYEAKMTGFFNEAGFDYTTWLDVTGLYDSELGNMYRMRSMYNMIKKYNFPVAKVKNFSVINHTTAYETFNYIDHETKYDAQLIKKHLVRLNITDRLCPFSPKKLKNFIENHDKIFIFGNGNYGKGLREYFHSQNWEIENMVVSEANQMDEISLNDVIFNEQDGIIIALGFPAAVQEVEEQLKHKLKKEQMLFPKL